MRKLNSFFALITIFFCSLALADRGNQNHKPVKGTIRITVLPNGNCSPDTIHLIQSQLTYLNLSDENAWLSFSSPNLDLNLMSVPGKPVRAKVIPQRAGTFKFYCKPAGSVNTTEGAFVVGPKS